MASQKEIEMNANHGEDPAVDFEASRDRRDSVPMQQVTIVV